MTRGAFGKPQKFCEGIYGLPANEIWGLPPASNDRPRFNGCSGGPSAPQFWRREAQMQLHGNGRAPWRSSSCHQSVCTRSGTLTPRSQAVMVEKNG
jgi:hypothetical protein